MDTVTKEVRSRIMSSIRSVSAMERAAREVASQKARCRLVHQPKGIPGKPDYANKTEKVAVFVHGCFFHQPCPKRCCAIPKSNRAFWMQKFVRNLERHLAVARLLKSAGWRVITVWEHEVRQRRRVNGK